MKKNILFLVAALACMTTITAQTEATNPITKYRRSSLYTLMIDDQSRPYANVIRASFEKGPIPEKFNDHNLGNRVISTSNAKDESGNITTFLENNHVARDVVAKWFNRSAKGGFNMDLIAKRGSYDASALDIAKAKASQRGLEAVADAGEELIKNTFILVNDYNYVSKEEVAKKVGGWLDKIGNVAASAGLGDVAATTTLTSGAVKVAGKGYVVKTNAYLYRLVWNEEVAAIFYNDYWADDKTITPERKKAFEESNIFKFELIGSDTSWADVQSTVFTKKTEEELIEKATIKAIDAVIVKLQKNHDEFKTKTPLYTGEPNISAKIGLKEGVSDKSKFDVLEQRQNKDGKTEYVVVGSLKVDDSQPIWDNRYGADEENPDSKVDRTYFKKTGGKDFYPGMLIVQKKGK
ncbi:hypothetical protein G4D82_01550 [Flavobacterium sp. CYK-4]|uniref:hypothetical protein n=1 Tax=Flavobacterium lotistagni TaxID=2709660 RepID=UPI0014082076|nr:hypothetical protein [Flavobacterium lotistagni]NHM05893.1 hypothetical protein [Flavobacterium lotistagni]